MFLSGHGLAESDAHGDPLDDDDLLLLLNAHHEAIPFVLPKPRLTHWIVLLDTAYRADAPSSRARYRSARRIPLQGRSMAVLCSTRGDDETPARDAGFGAESSTMVRCASASGRRRRARSELCLDGASHALPLPPRRAAGSS